MFPIKKLAPRLSDVQKRNWSWVQICISMDRDLGLGA